MFQQRLATGLTSFIVAIWALVMPVTAYAATMDVTDIQVSVQAEDAVKARDTAILQAQRQAFGILTGASVDNISDAQIARLVSGFSVRHEKVLSRSYAALFTVRFNWVATQNFVRLNNLSLNPTVLSGHAVSARGQEAVTSSTTPEAEKTQTATQTEQENILILPVLDIGARRVLWQDPNPWREVWQQKDQSQHGLNVRVPIGDVSDITDIPDTRFLNGGEADITNILDRYQAGRMYVIIAKNQGAALDPSGGMALSLYKHDGRKLQFVRKTVIHSRPGYAFNDAVPAAMQMIILANNRHVDSSSDEAAIQGEPTENPSVTVNSDAVPTTGTMVVTVPYQSLSQWVSIQKRLRQVTGIVNIIPSRVSPSSARLQINTHVSGDVLSEHLMQKGFELKKMPNGEIALIERMR